MSIVRYHQRTREDLVPWTDRLELAKVVANTDFVKSAMRGNPPAICAAILYGDEVGLGPMQSLAQISIIEGKPTLSAEAQRALILAAGHDFTVEESSVTRVTVAGRRRDSDHTVRVTWTLDDAKRAGIAGRSNWRAYPRQMLLARATAELARAIFADAIGGLAATEELEGAVGDAEGPATASTEAPTAAVTTKRRRKRVSPMTPSAAPSDSPPEGTPVPAEAPEKPAEDFIPPEDRVGPKPRDDEGQGAADTPGDVIEAMEADAAAEAAPEPVGDERPVTVPMKTRLNVLVGGLRDRGGHITTEQIYYAIGTLRRVTPEALEASIPNARDEDGRLHWAPLRESLTRGEARQLADWFTAKEAQVEKAIADESFQPPPLPGDDWE